jgi:ATP-dependent RNA helicase DDX54/DBP10
MLDCYDSRYSLTDGASFAEQAQRATFDLTTDELSSRLKKQSQLNWDKKKKKFIKGDGSGADNVKLVRTENGTKLPATYRNGRFDEWKKKSRVGLPKVGEKEDGGARRGAVGGRRFKHNKITPAQPLDKRRTDYERKVKRWKKREEAVAGDGDGKSSSAVPGKKGRYGGKPIGRVKSELKTNEQIRKGRKIMEKRKAKNARPKRVKKGRR